MGEMLRGCPLLSELMERYDEESRSADPKALGVVRVVEWLMMMSDSGRFPLAAEVGRVRARAELAPPIKASEPVNVERLQLEWLQAVKALAAAHNVSVARVKLNLHRDFDDFVDSLRENEPDIGPPPDGPVPIVGEPGWIPNAPPPSRQTTTELVATLQRRYPEDAEVRALIGKVTAAGAEVKAANDRAGRAIGEANALRERSERHHEALLDVLWKLSEASGDGKPGLNGAKCLTLADDLRLALKGDDE